MSYFVCCNFILLILSLPMSLTHFGDYVPPIPKFFTNFNNLVDEIFQEYGSGLTYRNKEDTRAVACLKITPNLGENS